MKFSVESCRVVFADAHSGGLMELHHEETHKMLGYPVMPNEGYYYMLEDKGILVTFTARIEGNLVGYATFMVTTSHHSNNEPRAEHDSIFIHPDHRGGGAFIEFARFCDQQLEADGVASIHWGMPARRAFIRIFSGLGYELSQYRFGRSVR